ncbi:tetratricopeptide repeat protein [Streptomyces halobius]|uniref:Tetratricopeptide repeat protein n=1 Tax=Streptomyces halobius TaxID=2879846 RepID=A0ABY4M845_9ACTN|nr:tetratricopeptide repeat protein [Streptomyces halobius]UQA93328.1 tetratricopeptide repeat protein [Streptomyces halobius]
MSRDGIEGAGLGAAAYGQGRIFQSERDIQVTEHHHHGSPGFGSGPASVRVPLAAPLRAGLHDREELREDLLSSLRTHGEVHVLHGFGGCGKTALARWLFEQAAPSTVAMWVEATTESQLRGGMLAVAADRGATPQEVQAAQEGRRAAADLVWQHLDASPEPWLLVLDNADDPKLLRDGWLRRSARGTVVVTSRQAVDPAWMAVRARLHRVDVLPALEAARLLHDLAPGEQQPEAALRLAERLGCHPLALTLAGGFLSQQLLESWTVEEYLERLEENPVSLLDRGAGLEGGARQRLSLTWQLSLDALAERGVPEAMATLRLLSCFADTPVPLLLLAPTALLAVQVPGLSAERIEAGLHGLISASLVDLIEVSTGQGRSRTRCVKAHGLLLETVAAALPTDEREQLTEAAAKLVSRSVREASGESTLVEPHLLGLLASDSADEELLDAARQIRTAHDGAGRWSDAVHLAAGIAQHSERHRTTDPVTAVADAIALGKILYQGDGLSSAVTVLRDALDRAGQIAEQAPLLLADAYAHTALAKAMLSEFAEAYELALRAAEIRERVLGATHADTADIIREQVGYLYTMGRFGEALALSRELIDLLPRLHGAHREEIATRSLLMRAAVMREALTAFRAADQVQDDEIAMLTWAEAEERAQEALQAYIRHFGSTHIRTAAARSNLALVMGERGDKDSATDELRRVLASRSAELGEEHPFTIETAADLARLLGLSGAKAEAAQLAQRSYGDALRILGPEHRITRKCVAALDSARE